MCLLKTLTMSQWYFSIIYLYSISFSNFVMSYCHYKKNLLWKKKYF